MTEPIGVAVLGCTGSIGHQALEVVAAHPDSFRVVALVAGSDEDELKARADEFGVPADRIGLGEAAAVELATVGDADVVLNAIVGSVGLPASIAALRAGKILALANKESLVAGGELCTSSAAEGGGSIVPVDSEHAAIAQCLLGVDRATIRRIVLTASGGPFRTTEDLAHVTPADALRHPTWSMGPKVTVDSATLMNKGLEVIEAHFLFDLALDRIDVLVHPQSVVHGMVELVDGSTILQAGPADMRIPIQAALAWPRRLAGEWARIDLAEVGSLTFHEVDRERFPALDLAYDAARRGRSYPAVLNAANEEAVRAFLDGRLSFVRIPSVVEGALTEHDAHEVDDLDSVMAADSWARRNVLEALDRGSL